VWLINAEYLLNMPGRKPMWPTRRGSRRWSNTAWSVPASCRRPDPELRDLTRHRRALVEERTRVVVQRLEKVMQDAGIKLTSVASALLTKSGRAILEALLAGQDDRSSTPPWSGRRHRSRPCSSGGDRGGDQQLYPSREHGASRV